MADLPCRAVDAGQELPAEDDAAADAGAEGDGHEVRDSAATAGDLLTEGRTVGVVFDVGGFVQPLFDEVAQRGIVEPEVRGELHDALFVDGTGGADADGCDVVEGHAGFAQREETGLPHGVGDLFGGTGRVRFHAGRSDHLILFVDDADGDVGTAEVDAKSYHSLCLPRVQFECHVSTSATSMFAASSFMPRPSSSSLAELCPIFLSR